MNFRVKKILVISLITLVAVALVSALAVISSIRADKVCTGINLEVSDYDQFQFISDKEVSAHLSNSGLYPVGMPHSDISLTAIEEKLMELNMVKRVVCNFTNNGNVSISVTQRVPVFRVKGEGRDYYVDNERKRMSTSLRFSAYVPVVTGSVSFEFATTRLYDFIEYIEGERRWATAFTQINVTPGDRVELIPRVGDFVIKMGQLDRYEAKLGKLDRFLEEMPKYQSWDKYREINLEYRDQVVCTKRRK